ncbi:MAG: chorismate synthase [Spirochaetaceae bacterium]|jgi:chorismate synthase|nr:chorismate synthase [Spirochaetaceae bacterium]
MSGNVFGKNFTVTTFGESHGAAVGCVIDGCPAGLKICEDDINADLSKRRPGNGDASTTRVEADVCEILSGVFEGVSLGAPIAIVIRNTNAHSADYAPLKDVYRPGHADKCWDEKYGLRDYRGGGRSSARETAGRVAAGAVARRLLAENGTAIKAWVSAVGGVEAPGFGEAGFLMEEIDGNSLRMPSKSAFEKALALVKKVKADGDSIGGVVSCRVTAPPPCLGEPVFRKLDALLASAILSIGAVKGFEIGAGFSSAALTGSQNNDAPLGLDLSANNAGGTLGGISTGLPLEFSAAFKPAPSIKKEQRAFCKDGSIRDISIKGRHDVCVCPRAVPVVEAMTALVLADLLLENRSSRL